MLVIELPFPFRFQAVGSHFLLLLSPSLHHLHHLHDVPAALRLSHLLDMHRVVYMLRFDYLTVK